jgi:hypothetical protein
MVPDEPANPLHAAMNYEAVYSSTFGTGKRGDHNFWGSLFEVCRFDHITKALVAQSNVHIADPTEQFGLYWHPPLKKNTSDLDLANLTKLNPDLLRLSMDGLLAVYETDATSCRERKKPMWAWEINLVSGLHRNHTMFGGLDPIIVCCMYRELRTDTLTKTQQRCEKLKQAISYGLVPGAVQFYVVSATDPEAMKYVMKLYGIDLDAL